MSKLAKISLIVLVFMISFVSIKVGESLERRNRAMKEEVEIIITEILPGISLVVRSGETGPACWLCGHSKKEMMIIEESYLDANSTKLVTPEGIEMPIICQATDYHYYCLDCVKKNLIELMAREIEPNNLLTLR